MKVQFDKKIVLVVPTNGDDAYQTYLLSQTLDDDTGEVLVSHVSGPTALFPKDADIWEVHDNRRTPNTDK